MPTSIIKLTQLRILNINYNNEIINLPEFNNFSELCELSILCYKLKYIPISIELCTKINMLKIYINIINYLPITLLLKFHKNKHIQYDKYTKCVTFFNKIN